LNHSHLAGCNITPSWKGIPHYRRCRGARLAASSALSKQLSRLVDEFLEEAYKPGMKAEDLYQVYIRFGEDPFIVGGDIRFSAWDYAKERSAQIAVERRD
jgi:hypothetical protein